MTKSRMFLAVMAVIAVIVVLVSFVVLRASSEKGISARMLNKAGLIYKQGEESLLNGEKDKATSAFFVVINTYPESQYAERALGKLAELYKSSGEYDKAAYYYGRLLKDFPSSGEADTVQRDMEDLNLKEMLSSKVTADSVEYTIQSGDTLFAISKRFNVPVDFIKSVNGLKTDLIRPGQKLKIVVSKFSILVDKALNKLYLKKDGEILKTYNVSTGKDNSTPVGVFKIEEKMVKPVWYKVGAVVPADSKEYELGERWMGLSLKGYGIHGTSDESTIGMQITHGCVRMYNAEVVELYNIVPSGTEVEIIDSAATPPVETKA